jgi:hypothetical protein
MNNQSHTLFHPVSQRRPDRGTGIGGPEPHAAHKAARCEPAHLYVIAAFSVYVPMCLPCVIFL